MNKREDLLDKISYSYFKLNDEPSKAFLLFFADYYNKVDFELSTNYCDIFYELYLSNERLSYDDIVEKYNICISTLDRCRIRFNKLAAKLIPKYL